MFRPTYLFRFSFALLCLFCLAWLTPSVSNAQNDPCKRFEVLTAKPKRDTAICALDSFRLLKNITDSTARFQWSSTPLVPLFGLNPKVNPKVSTKYYVTVTGGKDGCTTTTTDSIIVRVENTALDGLNDTTVCAETPVKLGNIFKAENVRYRWTPAQRLSSDTIPAPFFTAPTGATNLTLTASSPLCPTRSKSITITGVSLSVKIDGEDSLRVCAGAQVTLSAKTTPANEPITWRSDRDFGVFDTLANSVTARPIRISRYVATVRKDGCIFRDTVTIYTDSIPFNRSFRIVSVDKREDEMLPICEGKQVLLISPSFEPVLFPIIKFKWTYPQRAQVSTSDTLYNLGITADSTRTFFRELTNGVCKITDSVVVPVTPIPKVDIIPGNQSFCANALTPVTFTAILTNNPKFPIDKWEWTIEGMKDPIDKDSILNNANQFTKYTVTATVGKCPGTKDVSITPLPIPTLDPPTPAAFCPSGNIALNRSPNTNFIYSWTGPNSFASADGAPVASVAGTYNVTVTNRQTNCRTTFNVPVVQASAELTVSPDQTVCQGNVATITATPNNVVPSGGTIRWSNGVTANTTTFQALNPGTFPLTATLTFGPNCTLARTTTITVRPSFNLDITPDTFVGRLVDQGTDISLAAIVTGTASNPTYRWTSTNPDISSTNQNLAFKAMQSGRYSVEVNSSDGCRRADSVVINVRIPNFKVPNAFTPNGDTINSFFNIIFENGFTNPSEPNPQFWKGNIVVESMKVFNRLGAVVFDESTPSVLNARGFRGWDGTKSGSELPSDVYVYAIKLRLPDGTVRSVGGEVSLIR